MNAARRLPAFALHHVPLCSGTRLPKPKDDPRIAQYLPLCRAMARRWLTKMAGQLEFEDLVNIGLEAVWQATKSHDPDGAASFGTYARACVHNALNNRRQRVWRKARRAWLKQDSMHPQDDDDPGIDLQSALPSPLALLCSAEDHRSLREALSKLKPGHRDLLERIFVSDADPVDVARDISLSRQAVQQRSVYALRELRRHLRLAARTRRSA